MAAANQTNLDTDQMQPNEYCIWWLASKHMECEVMRAALRLANEFIFNATSDCVKHILLDFNVDNSGVDLIDDEFKHHIIQLADNSDGMSDENLLEFAKAYACFDANQKEDKIIINPDLMNFCKTLTSKSEGFHRVVFFLAVVS